MSAIPSRARPCSARRNARPSCSRLFEEYEAATKDEIRDLSPDQYRIWRNARVRAVEQFVKVVGDKPVTEVTDSDALDYMEWWQNRIVAEDMAVTLAAVATVMILLTVLALLVCDRPVGLRRMAAV